VPIDSRDADYIKRVIREKIARAGVVLCLVSAETHTSRWVDWELETAITLGKPIVAMAVKDLERASLPRPIRGAGSTSEVGIRGTSGRYSMRPLWLPTE
jgi:hypothetical protein